MLIDITDFRQAHSKDLSVNICATHPHASVQLFYLLSCRLCVEVLFSCIIFRSFPKIIKILQHQRVKPSYCSGGDFLYHILISYERSLKLTAMILPIRHVDEVYIHILIDALGKQSGWEYQRQLKFLA